MKHASSKAAVGATCAFPGNGWIDVQLLQGAYKKQDRRLLSFRVPMSFVTNCPVFDQCRRSAGAINKSVAANRVNGEKFSSAQQRRSTLGPQAGIGDRRGTSRRIARDLMSRPTPPLTFDLEHQPRWCIARGPDR